MCPGTELTPIASQGGLAADPASRRGRGLLGLGPTRQQVDRLRVGPPPSSARTGGPAGIQVWEERPKATSLSGGRHAGHDAGTHRPGLARRYRVDEAVTAIDALGQATRLKVPDIELLAERYRGRHGIRQARAPSASLTWGRNHRGRRGFGLLLIRAGFPPPQTQIPVYDEYGQLVAVVDMGWEDIKVGVDYEGAFHRTPKRYQYDLRRADALSDLGWIDVRVCSQDTEGGIIGRVGQGTRASVVAPLRKPEPKIAVALQAAKRQRDEPNDDEPLRVTQPTGTTSTPSDSRPRRHPRTRRERRGPGAVELGNHLGPVRASHSAPATPAPGMSPTSPSPVPAGSAVDRDGLGAHHREPAARGDRSRRASARDSPSTRARPSDDLAGNRVVQPDELGDERGGRAGVQLGGRRDLLEPARLITPTRSAIASASSWSWVTNRVVVPTSSWTRRISSRSCTRTLASSADSGSSSSSTCGWIASARASATRCCWPPDSWWRTCPLRGQPDQLQHLAGPGHACRALACRAASARRRRCRGRSGAGTGCRPGTPCPCRACWPAPR